MHGGVFAHLRSPTSTLPPPTPVDSGGRKLRADPKVKPDSLRPYLLIRTPPSTPLPCSSPALALPSRDVGAENLQGHTRTMLPAHTYTPTPTHGALLNSRGATCRWPVSLWCVPRGAHATGGRKRTLTGLVAAAFLRAAFTGDALATAGPGTIPSLPSARSVVHRGETPGKRQSWRSGPPRVVQSVPVTVCAALSLVAAVTLPSQNARAHHLHLHGSDNHSRSS